MGLAALVLAPDRIGFATNLLASFLVVPYILFSPFFGWMADRFSKTRVLGAALLFQGGVAVLVVAAVALRRFDLALAGFFLFGIQTAWFSPAKQGILKELVGEAKLNAAVGWMEGLTIVGILAGSFVGGVLLDALTRRTGDAWTGGAAALGLLALGCGAAWLLFRGVPVLPARSAEPFRPSLFWVHFHDLRHLARQPALFGVSAGIAWFYGLGGLLYLIVVQAGRQAHPGVGAASYSGGVLALLGCGIIGGAALYARLSRDRISLRTVPWSAAGLAGALLLAAALPPAHPSFLFAFFLVGLAGGTFIIPLNAYLQDKAEDRERGRMIGAMNLLTNLTGIGAVAAHALMADRLGWGPGAQLAVLAATAALVLAVALRARRNG